MPSKNSVNNKEVLKDLEKKISPVLVVNNSALKPYVELFDYAPENIYQQPLGSLVGFFEVKEYSDDSAYVVNFLTAVLKKEYYINPKRPVTESLDSALHKVNMALSELAKHGNIEWLGKLNAAICVLEKNNAHFSVSGKAKIFLYRSGALTEISEDLASDSLEPHPLKTFVNVSSGRMEKNDRLLITSADIFHILSMLELKKNFQRFEGDKFVQFLKTALSNQMEMIASIVVGMVEAESPVVAKTTLKKKTARAANVFSEKTFAETTDSTMTIEESLSLMDTSEADAEYTDKKTGHIYVQGEAQQPGDNQKTSIFWEATKEKFGEAWYLTKNGIRRRVSLYKKQLAKKKELRRIEKEKLAEIKEEELKHQQEERILHELQLEEQRALEKEAQRILAEEQELLRLEAQKLAEIQQKKEHERINLEERENARLATEKLQMQIKQQQATNAEQFVSRRNNVQANTQADKKIAPVDCPAVIREIKPARSQKELAAELSFQEKLQLAIEQQQHDAIVDLRSPKDTAPIDLEDHIELEYFQEREGLAALPVPIHLQAEINAAKKEARKKAIELFIQNIKAGAKKNSLSIIKTTHLLIAKFAKSNNQEQTSQTHSQKNTHITPRFFTIRKAFSKFTFKQKMYTLIALALVFVVPLFIVHFMNAPKKPTITDLQTNAPKNPAQAAPTEKNMRSSMAQTQIITSRSDILSTLITNVGLAAFTKNSVLMFDGTQIKEYPITSGEGSIAKVAFMSDLSLVFILTDQNKIISFSPISLKFTDNNISLPANASSDFIGTYMTYLYVLDPSTNQIYRYPRTDGGFGDKTSWLKDATVLSGISDATIDDSIYAIKGNQIIKFFKGQGQPMTLESSQTPVHFDKIYTTLDSTSFWALDAQNSRLVAYTKDTSSITSQYHSDVIKNATSFSVDEKNKIAYIVTSSGLTSIALQ